MKNNLIFAEDTSIVAARAESFFDEPGLVAFKGTAPTLETMNPNGPIEKTYPRPTEITSVQCDPFKKHLYYIELHSRAVYR